MHQNIKGVDVPIYRGIRTARHTYAVGEQGRWLLFDNQEDPSSSTTSPRTRVASI